MYGSTMFIHGGISPSLTENKINPLSDLHTIDIGMTTPFYIQSVSLYILELCARTRSFDGSRCVFFFNFLLCFKPILIGVFPNHALVKKVNRELWVVILTQQLKCQV